MRNPTISRTWRQAGTHDATILCQADVPVRLDKSQSAQKERLSHKKHGGIIVTDHDPKAVGYVRVAAGFMSAESNAGDKLPHYA
ncbi:MAG TPA: hypothetical protein VN285_05735 [Candidatus Deferrimicrobium sp.]|nr:hypothetical protein [Candidatus Deferrimicrobium sp.]